MTELEQLEARAARLRRQLDAKNGEAQAVLSQGKKLEGEIKSLTLDVSDYERVNTLLTTIGEDKQSAAQGAIEDLVTSGLQTIFDPSLSFHIIQSVKGKNASVEFVVRTTIGHSVVETGVLDARGGGLATTVGFLLRVVVMLLKSGNRQEQVLFLDETFSMVSAEYLDGVGQFLRELVDRTGIQIVMVTHQSEFIEYGDKVYHFSQSAGETVVKEIA